MASTASSIPLSGWSRPTKSRRHRHSLSAAARGRRSIPEWRRRCPRVRSAPERAAADEVADEDVAARGAVVDARGTPVSRSASGGGVGACGRPLPLVSETAVVEPLVVHEERPSEGPRGELPRSGSATCRPSTRSSPRRAAVLADGDRSTAWLWRSSGEPVGSGTRTNSWSRQYQRSPVHVRFVTVGHPRVAKVGRQDAHLVAPLAQVLHGGAPHLLVATEVMRRVQVAHRQEPHWRDSIAGRLPRVPTAEGSSGRPTWR